MYSFLDQSPDRLTGGSHFILWAMRGWVMAVMKEKCPAASLMQPFTRMGMRTVLSDFHQLMFTVNHRGQRRMAFGDSGHGTITEIEAIFLALWADMAEGEDDRARKVLHLLIVDEKVEEVFAGLKRVVCHMETINFAPNRVLQALPAG